MNHNYWNIGNATFCQHRDNHLDGLDMESLIKIITNYKTKIYAMHRRR